MPRREPQRILASAGQRDEPRKFQCAVGKVVTIKAAEGEGEEAKLPTFEGIAYTGQPMRPCGWWNLVIIDLDGVKAPSQHRPALRQHDHEQIVGHTTEVKVEKDGIRVAGVFSGQQEHVDKVVVPARNEFQWQLSIGADPVRTEYLEAGEEAEVNGRTITGPMTISRETEIGEISFVPLGADGDTSVTVAASKGDRSMNWKNALKQLMADLRAAGKVTAAKYTDEEVDEMSADDARAALKKAMKDADEQETESEEEEETESEDEEEEKKSESSKKTKVAAKGKKSLKAEADSVIRKIRADAAKEHQRQADIVAACRRHGVTEVEIETIKGGKQRVNLAAHAIEHNWTAERAELHALRSARPGPGVGVPGGLGYATNRPEINGAVIEAAILHAARHQFRLEDDDFYFDRLPDGQKVRRVPAHLQRETQGELKARYGDQVQQAAHTLYRGQITPKQIFSICFRANGLDVPDLSGEQGVRAMLQAWDHLERVPIRAEGASNLSISNILANVLNKFALQGYLFVEQAWREISAIRPVSDFKPTKSINLLGDVMYKAIGPTGELKNAELGDQAFANQAAPYGRILTIPWVHTVNDDLSMLTGAPMKIGQGAGLALNDEFWTTWAAPGNADDGNPFWNNSAGTHGAAPDGQATAGANNLTGASSALSSTSLTSAKKLFDNQVDPNGNPLGFDGAQPILLHPPTLWRTVAELLQAPALVYGGATAALQPNVNVWAGMMRPVMSRYLENANYGNSATAWYILFNPAALPVIEVAFLNGVDTPAVLQAGPDYQFDRLGITIRGTMPFGVNMQNFRAGVKSNGA